MNCRFCGEAIHPDQQSSCEYGNIPHQAACEIRVLRKHVRGHGDALIENVRLESRLQAIRALADNAWGANSDSAAIDRILEICDASREDTRACTCHPDDNPPVPCPKKYALQDCRAAAKLSSGDST